MTDKKKHLHQEINESNAEAVAQSAQDEMAETMQLSAQIEELEKQLEEAKSSASEYKEGWMRSQAEFQNYRKRTERDNELLYTSLKGDIIKKVLPVVDDLERALQNRPSDSGPWISGIELIHKKLVSVLESEGVKKIEAQGAPFDPNFHEAISYEPAAGFESGQVISVVQNGYMIGDRLVRPALVRVAQ
jgi:molecular chaperone GrpE